MSIEEQGVTSDMTPAGRDQQQASSTPTRPAPKPPGLASVLARNIEALQKRRAEEKALATFEERLAGRITRFTGSMRFVYLHLAIFGLWIVGNLGLIPGFPQFDPSFVVLAMVASVEAIFLSTFVLISQNRMAAAADKRDEPGRRGCSPSAGTPLLGNWGTTNGHWRRGIQPRARSSKYTVGRGRWPCAILQQDRGRPRHARAQ